MKWRYQRMISVASSIGQHRPAVVGVHWSRLEQERCHDAEVATPTAHCPEQVGILLGAGGNEPAVGQHHFDGQQIVDGQAIPPRQVTDPAPQSQSGHAGRRDDARRNRETERMRRMVYVAPERSASDLHGPLLWVYANIVHW